MQPRNGGRRGLGGTLSELGERIFTRSCAGGPAHGHPERAVGPFERVQYAPEELSTARPVFHMIARSSASDQFST